MATGGYDFNTVSKEEGATAIPEEMKTTTTGEQDRLLVGALQKLTEGVERQRRQQAMDTERLLRGFAGTVVSDCDHILRGREPQQLAQLVDTTISAPITTSTIYGSPYPFSYPESHYTVTSLGNLTPPLSINPGGITSVGTTQVGVLTPEPIQPIPQVTQYIPVTDYQYTPPLSTYQSSPIGTPGVMSDEQFRHFMLERQAAQETQLNLLSQAVSLLTQMLAKPRQNKAVPPPKFHPDRDQDLRMFFDEFEEYCTVMYPAQHQDWVRLLGSYLEGSYLDLYHQVRKTHNSYDSVKQEFLRWNDQESLVRKEKAMQTFMFAQMRKTESVRVFAVRLLDLAKKAYPEVPAPQLAENDTVRQVFLAALPVEINRAMLNHLKNTEWSSGVRMKFDQIVSWADRHHLDLKSKGQTSAQPEVVDISRVEVTEQNKVRQWTDVVSKWRDNANIASESTPSPQKKI